MKLIESFKSSNYDDRKANFDIKYIILHYTAMTHYSEAIKHMCSNKNKVSSHFLVSKEGDIFYLVDIKNRAWHAGDSYWKGLIDLNSSSIGIEIDNSGALINNEDYSKTQILSLCKLIAYLSSTYKINYKNILGHSDIAPFRKIDPGRKFPWSELAKKGLSYLPKINQNIIFDDFSEKIDLKTDNFSPNINDMLSLIGYDTREALKNNKKFELLIKSYQRHYRQLKVTGKADRETIELLKQHCKDLLT